MKVWQAMGMALLLSASFGGAALADEYSEPADRYFRQLAAGQASSTPPVITLLDAGESKALTEAELRRLLSGCDILMTQMGLLSRDPFRFFYHYGANCEVEGAKFSALELKLTQSPSGDRIESIDVSSTTKKIVLPPPPRNVN